MTRYLRAFAMGALLFPLLDALHTHFDVLAYTRPWFFRMAWWVPIEFGAMWVIVAFAVPQLETALATNVPSREPTPDTLATLELVAFAVLYALTAVLDTFGSTVVSVVLGLALLVRIAWLSEPRDLPFVAASALIGPLGECLVSSTGGFAYGRPELWRVPFWLPLLWAHGGFFARRLFRHPSLAPARAT